MGRRGGGVQQVGSEMGRGKTEGGKDREREVRQNKSTMLVGNNVQKNTQN